LRWVLFWYDGLKLEEIGTSVKYKK